MDYADRPASPAAPFGDAGSACSSSPCAGESRAQAAQAACPRAGQPSAPRPAAGRVVADRPARPSSTSAFVRAENEDDDGYDPYSDRPARPEPLFESDPWR